MKWSSSVFTVEEPGRFPLAETVTDVLVIEHQERREDKPVCWLEGVSCMELV